MCGVVFYSQIQYLDSNEDHQRHYILQFQSVILIAVPLHFWFKSLWQMLNVNMLKILALYWRIRWTNTKREVLRRQTRYISDIFRLYFHMQKMKKCTIFGARVVITPCQRWSTVQQHGRHMHNTLISLPVNRTVCKKVILGIWVENKGYDILMRWLGNRYFATLLIFLYF